MTISLESCTALSLETLVCVSLSLRGLLTDPISPEIVAQYIKEGYVTKEGFIQIHVDREQHRKLLVGSLQFGEIDAEDIGESGSQNEQDKKLAELDQYGACLIHVGGWTKFEDGNGFMSVTDALPEKAEVKDAIIPLIVTPRSSEWVRTWLEGQCASTIW